MTQSDALPFLAEFWESCRVGRCTDVTGRFPAVLPAPFRLPTFCKFVVVCNSERAREGGQSEDNSHRSGARSWSQNYSQHGTFRL